MKVKLTGAGWRGHMKDQVYTATAIRRRKPGSETDVEWCVIHDEDSSTWNVFYSDPDSHWGGTVVEDEPDKLEQIKQAIANRLEAGDDAERIVEDILDILEKEDT